MSQSRSQLVVRSRRPWLRWLAAVIVLATLAATGWTSFEYGRQRAGYDAAEADRRVEDLESKLKALRARNEALKQRVIELERAAEVDEQAYEEVRHTVNRLQTRLAELGEELAFYRNIVSPATYEPGLHIESFELKASSAERGYRYNLVLMQVAKNYRRARGGVEITLEGQRGGEHVTLNLEALTEDGTERLVYGFKYFQALEGELLLPEGFDPARVHVRAVPRGGSEPEIEQSYAWSKLTG